MKTKYVMCTLLLAVAMMIIPSAFAAPPQNDTVNISLEIHTAPNITDIIFSQIIGIPDNITLNANALKPSFCTFNYTDVDGISDINKSSVKVIMQEKDYVGGFEVGKKVFLNTTPSPTGSCVNMSEGTDWVHFQCVHPMPHYTTNGTWECIINITDNTGLKDTDNATTVVEDLIALNISRTNITFNPIAVQGNTTNPDYNVTIQNIGNVPLDISLNAVANESTPTADTYAMNCTSGQINESDMWYRTSYVNDGLATWTSFSSGFEPVGLNILPGNASTPITSSDLFFGVSLINSGNPTGTCDGFLFFNAISA